MSHTNLPPFLWESVIVSCELTRSAPQIGLCPHLRTEIPEPGKLTVV